MASISHVDESLTALVNEYQTLEHHSFRDSAGLSTHLSENRGPIKGFVSGYRTAGSFLRKPIHWLFVLSLAFRRRHCQPGTYPHHCRDAQMKE
jgi:hypothetical protein